MQRLKSALAMGSTFEGNLNATMCDRCFIATNSAAEKLEREDQIRELMKRVSDFDRRMLDLLLKGHSIAETARTLGVEPATLRMRLSRLRVRLRKVDKK